MRASSGPSDDSTTVRTDRQEPKINPPTSMPIESSDRRLAFSVLGSRAHGRTALRRRAPPLDHGVDGRALASPEDLTAAGERQGRGDGCGTASQAFRLGLPKEVYLWSAGSTNVQTS